MRTLWLLFGTVFVLGKWVCSLVVGLLMAPIVLGMLLWTSLTSSGGGRARKDGTIFGVKNEAAAIRSALATTFTSCTQAAGKPLTRSEGLRVVNKSLALAQLSDEQVVAVGTSILSAALIWWCFEKVLEIESSTDKEKVIWFALGMKYTKPFHDIDLEHFSPIQRNQIEAVLQRQISGAQSYRAALGFLATDTE